MRGAATARAAMGAARARKREAEAVRSAEAIADEYGNVCGSEQVERRTKVGGEKGTWCKCQQKINVPAQPAARRAPEDRPKEQDCSGRISRDDRVLRSKRSLPPPSNDPLPENLSGSWLPIASGDEHHTLHTTVNMKNHAFRKLGRTCERKYRQMCLYDFDVLIMPCCCALIS